jgi:hypothetical protein
MMMFAPIFNNISKIPVLSGFKPTPVSKISESGTMEAATIKNAAAEISPGTTMGFPSNDCRPCNPTWHPSTCKGTSK